MSETITRLFDDLSDARRAVSELERNKISPDNISLIGNDHSTARRAVDKARVEHKADEDAGKGALVGAAVGGAGGLLAGLGMVAIPGLGPLLAVGWLASTAAGAVAGAATAGAATGLVSALVRGGVKEDDAHVYAEGVRRGGALVSVIVADSDRLVVESILLKFNGVDSAARGAAYRASGWTGYDALAAPYSPEEPENERRDQTERTISRRPARDAGKS